MTDDARHESDGTRLVYDSLYALVGSLWELHAAVDWLSRSHPETPVTEHLGAARKQLSEARNRLDHLRQHLDRGLR